MTLPNFLVVGAARSGTTYLDRLLRQHPQVYLPQARKELNFFIQNPAEIKMMIGGYENYFAPANQHKAIGEISPSYMLFEQTAALIAEHLGQVRLVFLLRNPVKRTYSDYHLQLNKGYEYLTFPDALAQESVRVQQGRIKRLHYSYTGRGYYMHQIERFLPLFPRERLHFIIAEDFYADTAGELAWLCRFLDIDDAFNFDLETFRYHVGVPRYSTLYRWLIRLYREGGRKRGLYRLAQLAQNLAERMPQDNRPYPPLPSKLYKTLQQLFTPDYRALSAFLGRELSHWERLPASS